MKYLPNRVLFEEKSLEYPLGQRLYKKFNDMKIPTDILKNNRVTAIPKETPQMEYGEGKATLVIRVRKNKKFESCKPSAHYQLPLISGCTGKCEYCYLNTRFGKKPYTTIYVNVDEILNTAEKYMEERKPEITYYEMSATSDPIPFERYTKILGKVIEFMGDKEYGRLRFVTKFDDVDDLLDINHNGHTTIRFSINTFKVINEYEHATVGLNERLIAAKKVMDKGYPTGFIIGPVIIYENWKNDYDDMLITLKESLSNEYKEEIHFEVISHRYTNAAKNRILQIFPNSTLPMDEERRVFKYGQFGYGKYVYDKEILNEIREYFNRSIKSYFPNSIIDYII
ncbi:spore photoproduct lyase [Clostridiisalibacter paucivorans]|uniref:spore photoproduct lyase n=1 Tax=Clostridiisalibacter paucivorans TaxID=408753 RepID=UPI00047D8766|nr:spore photoproduct lyase [Clostridiisalibacter paucivorans]